MIIFTTSAGTLSLFELFSAIAEGRSVELARMQPHQRFPAVTAFAVLMTVLKRYATSPPQSAKSWESEWNRQIGEDALRLVAPESEVAFFQPPLDPDGYRSRLTLSDIDLVFYRLMHATKPVEFGDAEEAVFALMSGAWARSVAKWNSGTRYSPAGVLASDDGTFAGEVRHLIQAYEISSSTIGREATPTCAADHILWLRPVSAHSLDPDDVPWPYLEARPCHLLEIGNNRYAGTGQHSVPSRIAGKISAEDPHTPIIHGKPYRFDDKRRFETKTLHEALFGSERTTRPKALSVSGFRCVRVCLIPTDNGKTLGYREALFPLSKKSAFSFASNQSRAADLSQRALDAIKETSKVLSRATRMVVAGTDGSHAVISRRAAVESDYRHRVMLGMTQTVLDLLGEEGDQEKDQQALQKQAAQTAREVWATVRTGCHRPLEVARATRYLNWALDSKSSQNVAA